MDETRKKKVKHAKTMHKEGRIFTENCLIECPPVESINKGKVAETKTVTNNHVVRTENEAGEVERNRQRMTTVASGEKVVELNQNDLRATIGDVAQHSQGRCIPPRFTPPLFKPSDLPPLARRGASRNVPLPSYTHPPVNVPPSHDTKRPRNVRPLRNGRWLPYGSHNMLHPYWRGEPWDWIQSQSRWGSWTSYPVDQR